MDVQIAGLDIWGDVHDTPPLAAPGSIMLPPEPHARETQSEATRRWRIEGISEQVAACRDRWRADYLADHPGAKRRTAHDYAWQRALAEFPPPGVVPSPPAVVEVEPEPPAADPVAPVAPAEPPPVAADPPAAADQSPPAAAPASPSAGGVQGLGDIPEGWPVLPSNAALQAEVSWVQANRLRVRHGEGVDLSRALSPAPSHAALGWLETSILYPSKFADVTVKASGDQADDAEDIRRERIGIAELRTLLSEARGST